MNLLHIKNAVCQLSGNHSSFHLHLPNLILKPGQRIAIVGPSGCGKSTLLEMLALIRPPNSSKTFDLVTTAEEILDISYCWKKNRLRQLDQCRAKHLAYIPQRGGYFPAFSVSRNVIMRASLAGIAKNDARKRLKTLSKNMGLSERLLDRLPDSLSTGERQRVTIMLSLIHSPQLVMADEPTSALHPSQSEKVLMHLVREASINKAALVVATHDIELVKRLGFFLMTAKTKEFEGEVHSWFEWK